MLTRSIWNREGENEMSKAAFIRAVAFFTLIVGFLVPGGAALSYNWQFTWPLLIGTFIAAIVGIFMFQLSKNPLVSFVGVSLMSAALGLMIGPAVAAYSTIVVLEAVLTTGAIMVVMSFLGIIYPAIFEGFGPFLMGGLILLIVAGFAQIIFASLGFTQALDMPILAWVGVGIFTLFVAYDWSKALKLPYTLDNAIDASGGLILDAVNLFLRLMQIYASAQGGSIKTRR